MSERTDYLIIGTGAMGLAFADTLLVEKPDATITLVDRYTRPGGHWNVAYPFVTLHQPSSFYGVASRELSKGRIDRMGYNKGLADLATLPELRDYFDSVMRDTLLPSGRVTWHPGCDFEGVEGKIGRFTHRLSGETKEVEFGTLVDGTHLNTSVPKTHTPNFAADPGATLMPLNDLPEVATPPSGYTVIGGGKTGIDACLWLLEQGVPSERIRWVISRDGYMLNRLHAQTSAEHYAGAIGNVANMFEAIAQSTSQADMFDRLVDCGYFLQLDADHRPTMFHAPTVSEAELDALRTIPVVRMGRVRRIGLHEIELTDGTIPTDPDHIHVDCSASPLKNIRAKPVFAEDRITLQTVRAFQPAFSASFIAHIEASDRSEAEKNALTGVVPLPDSLDDFVRMQAANMMNQAIWGRDPELRAWMAGNRLDGFSKVPEGVTASPAELAALSKRIRAAGMPAAMKLASYLQRGGEGTPIGRDKAE